MLTDELAKIEQTKCNYISKIISNQCKNFEQKQRENKIFTKEDLYSDTERSIQKIFLNENGFLKLH